MSQTITVCELTAWEQEVRHFQSIDVRSTWEFKTGHIPGAINIPMDEIESRIADLNPRLPIVLICQAGTRAQITANLLAGRHPDLRVLQGGTNGWKAAGRPVICHAKVRWSLERQVRLVAGFLATSGVVLAITVHPYWLGLSGFVGLGLIFAGITDICAMGMLLAKMPWNRSVQQTGVSAVTDGQACTYDNSVNAGI
jgi:rhodanese-related sulfurtransferase